MNEDLTSFITIKNGELLDEIQEAMNTHGISQANLASAAGYSRTHLNQLLKRRKPLTDSARMRLAMAMQGLTGQTELDVCIDYLGVTFKTHDYEELIESIIQIRYTNFYVGDTPHYGYSQVLLRGDIQVLLSPYQDERAEDYDPEHDKGTMIEMKGAGCRYLERFLRSQKRSWYDFLNACIGHGGKFTRVDLAVNDRFGVLNVAELIGKCERGEYSSRFHGFRDNRTTRGEHSGSTLYLGSPTSEVHFCIYDKAFEQHQKNPELAIADAPIKTRFEVRLRRERATAAVADLIQNQSPETTVFGIINHYLRFLTPSHKARQDWALDPKWAAFTGRYREKLRLSTDPKPLSFEDTFKWLTKQVSPALKMIKLIDEYTGSEYLNAILNAGKLTGKHWDVINHYKNGDGEDFIATIGEQSKEGDYADQSK